MPGRVAVILWLIVTNFGQVALLPRYQEQLLAMIQQGAVRFGIDDEPNWETLRRDVLAHVNLQRVVFASAASVASIVATFTVVLIVILVGLVAWMAIWGIAGAILSVPIMAILVIVFSEFESTRPIAVLLSKDGRVR